MSSFPTTPSLSLYTQVRTAIAPSTPVLRPAVNTHHPQEARNKAKARATLSPVKTAAVVGVGVVGLMGLHQVWGKVHAFLFGEPVADKPASIPPTLVPAVEAPEPPPVRKVNWADELVDSGRRNTQKLVDTVRYNTQELVNTGRRNTQEAVDTVIDMIVPIVEDGWERDRSAQEWIQDKKTDVSEVLGKAKGELDIKTIKLKKKAKQGIIKGRRIERNALKLERKYLDYLADFWERIGYDPLVGRFKLNIPLEAQKILITHIMPVISLMF